MRVALISDIHGNATALEAVLADIAQEQVDQIICLGDVITGGPQPQRVVALLRDVQVVLVLGNGDHRLHNPISPEGLEDHLRILVDTEAWARQVLPEVDLAWLRQASLTHETQLIGKRLLCCHASPRRVSEGIVAELTDAELSEILQGYSFDILAAGHTHVPMLRKYGNSVLINPGAVGSPTGEGSVARYAMVSIADGRIDVDFRSMNYDIAPAIGQALTNGMPHAAWWASRWNIDCTGLSGLG